MVITVYCDDPKCAAYKKHVKFTFVYLRGRACAVCGKPMVDGERSNDDFKSGRKRAIKVFIGKARSARFKIKKKRSATKQIRYKR